MNVRRVDDVTAAYQVGPPIVEVPAGFMQVTDRQGTRIVRKSEPAQPLAMPAMPMPAPMELGAALLPAGTSHDASSAYDRARGFVLRFAMLGIVVTVLAVLGVFVFVWTASNFGLHPGWFERVLVFLGALGLGLLYGGYKLNLVDYSHSATGVEHHRLDTLQDMHAKQLETELEARRMALAASLRLLERRNDER